MRTTIKTVAAVAVLLMAAWLGLPRLWIKNSKTRLVYNGRVSEKMKLYHGKGDRLLIFIGEPEEQGGAYVLAPMREGGEEYAMEQCPARNFARGKFAAVELRRSGCHSGERGGQKIIVRDRGVRFAGHGGALVEASWFEPPR